MGPGRCGKAMIVSIMIVNNHGKARLTKFYDPMTDEQQQRIVRESFNLVSKRPAHVCNFLDGEGMWGEDTKVIYRHYATLYFVFVVDSSESELGILDLIQVFV